MKIICRHLFAIILASSVPVHAVLAAAPVVDDSENFAILDEQQADMDQPVVGDLQSEEDDEVALAHDNGSNTSNNLDAVNKIQGLQQEIQELRGQLEVQAHDLKQLQQQQLAFYKDVDARLRGSSNQVAKGEPATELSIGTKNNPTAGNSTIPAPTSQPQASTQPISPQAATIIPATRGNPADEQLSYLAAYELVKNKRFDDALKAMQNFVRQYPQGGYTANAQYWLGELYMVQKDYIQAIEHFDIVLKQFPGSSKAAACTLKIGYALAASGKSTEARQRLQQVLKNYPDTPTAQLAVAKLQSLKAS